MLRQIFSQLHFKANLPLPQIRAISRTRFCSNIEDQDPKKEEIELKIEEENEPKIDFGQFRSENRIKIVNSTEDVPDPILDFEHSGFSSGILKNLERSGFVQPMPIQAQGWPIALSGSDMIAIGETGSGKTLGFLLPAFMHINKVNRENPGTDPICLILAPTRELAQQIEQVAKQYGKGVMTTCVFGGASKMYQSRQLQRKTDILVATPGRLIDFIESGIASLERCSYVVLDEADRMLDMGFEPQLRRILEEVPANRQMLMWSATWPKEVETLAKDFLKDGSNPYVHLNIGSIDLQANQNIEQQIKVIEDHDKRDTLIEIAQENKHEGKILIFANTKRTVDFIVKVLQRYDCRAIGIHGDKTQQMRDNALNRFRSGSYNILVASDVAARGLDVNDIKLVINYDMPANTEDYIHRIGRTGRSGKAGKSVSFLVKDSTTKHFQKSLVSVLKKANQEVPEELTNMNNFAMEQKRRTKGYQNQFWKQPRNDHRNNRRYQSLDDDDYDDSRSSSRQRYQRYDDYEPRRYQRNDDYEPRRYQRNDDYEPRRYQRDPQRTHSHNFEDSREPSRPNRYQGYRNDDKFDD